MHYTAQVTQMKGVLSFSLFTYILFHSGKHAKMLREKNVKVEEDDTSQA